jgi:hypothetical protein
MGRRPPQKFDAASRAQAHREAMVALAKARARVRRSPLTGRLVCDCARGAGRDTSRPDAPEFIHANCPRRGAVMAAHRGIKPGNTQEICP